MHLNLRHNVIGPFQFLALSLIVSEILLGWWMYQVKDSLDFIERIVIGSLSIAVVIAVLDSFKKFEDDLDITFEKFKESFNHVVLKQIFPNALGIAYDREAMIQKWWYVYKLILPMHKKYDITFNDMRLWLRNTRFFNRDELDSSLNQLNPSIESRDWYASVMNSFRFRDDFRVLLNQKNML